MVTYEEQDEVLQRNFVMTEHKYKPYFLAVEDNKRYKTNVNHLKDSDLPLFVDLHKRQEPALTPGRCEGHQLHAGI